MAYPGEIHRGDTVRWADTASLFPDATYLTRRVPIVKLHLVRKAEEGA